MLSFWVNHNKSAGLLGKPRVLKNIAVTPNSYRRIRIYRQIHRHAIGFHPMPSKEHEMTLNELLKSKREQILRTAKAHGAYNVRVFGSVARGDARENSDVDLLIDIVGPTTPWFPGGLLADLETALGRRVDIVIARSLHPLLRESVLKEAVPL